MTPCDPSHPRLTFEPANPAVSGKDKLLDACILCLVLVFVVMAAVVVIREERTAFMNAALILTSVFVLTALLLPFTHGLGRWVSWYTHRLLPFGDMERQVLAVVGRELRQPAAAQATHIPIVASWRLDADGVRLHSLRIGGVPKRKFFEHRIALLPALALRTRRWGPVQAALCTRFHVRPKAHALLHASTAHNRLALMAALARAAQPLPPPSTPQLGAAVYPPTTPLAP